MSRRQLVVQFKSGRTTTFDPDTVDQIGHRIELRWSYTLRNGKVSQNLAVLNVDEIEYYTEETIVGGHDDEQPEAGRR